MQFSVVGLPHYTIWHLYEPSVDDIRHMEVKIIPLYPDFLPQFIAWHFYVLTRALPSQEMEQERLAKEAEEKEKAEREKKIKDAFDDTNTQWQKDKTEIQNLAKEAKEAAKDDAAAAAAEKAKAAGSKGDAAGKPKNVAEA